MATFIRLVDYDALEKEKNFFDKKNKYIYDVKKSIAIPGEPLVYQASDKLLSIFNDSELLGDLAVARNGMKTGKNDEFVRLWWEVSVEDALFDAQDSDEAIASGKKWFPYNKGGSPRKWYGNNDCVVNWENGGQKVIGEAKKDGRHVQDYPLDMKFRESITWSLINTKRPTFRYKKGNISDIAGMSFYKSGELTKYLLAICNSTISTELLKMIAPTINYQAGDIARIPVSIDVEKRPIIESLVDENVSMAKEDWDDFEESWDFLKTPLMCGETLIEKSYNAWKEKCEKRIQSSSDNEKKIDDLFLEIYELDESIFEMTDNDSTLYVPELKKDIERLISYAVGCIMGRYSLKEEGLIYAGGRWDSSRYSDDFRPCDYGVMLITEDQYFEEDLCTRVIDFIEVVYGKDTLNENLNFIAQALNPGAKESARQVIRNYLYDEKGFFDNHYQVYQHRPIYWMMSSGKNGGFRAIVYMHRYDQNTLSIVRSEFLHELRYKYEADQSLQHKKEVEAATTADRNDAKKKVAALDKKMVEINQYDDLVNHATGNITAFTFDLDDGVKTNYSKFLSIDGVKTQNLLVPIKL